MRCFQVKMRFAFVNGKSALVSVHTRQLEAAVFLVTSALPFGYPLKHSRFFATEKEAQEFVAHLQKVYANRTISTAVVTGSQKELF